MTHPDTSMPEQSSNSALIPARQGGWRNRAARLGGIALLGATLGLGVTFAHTSSHSAPHAAYAQTALLAGASAPRVGGGPSNG
jgi:hypothetical protein